ncbi:hypothetical protein C8K63_1305 [Pseudomonas sp. GV085]|nr:hypothetical protein C8K63_1305 [Pseudomonas sp. GV085]
MEKISMYSDAPCATEWISKQQDHWLIKAILLHLI